MTEPAPALAGHSQVVSARYLFCGLETMLVLVSAACSAAAGFAALIVGIFTRVGFKHYGWRQPPALLARTLTTRFKTSLES